MYEFVYVCIHVCVYVCIHVCMYACMYVGMYVSMYACVYVRMYACMYVRMYVCIHALYVCTYLINAALSLTQSLILCMHAHTRHYCTGPKDGLCVNSNAFNSTNSSSI
jgi:hypothetical protein